MADRIYNFNAGPSTLPLEVLKQAQQEFLDYRGSGMSIMEISHRSAEFDEINESAISLIRELAGLSDEYHVLFLGGGASTQFAMIPLNLLSKDQTAAYVDTGAWSSKAISEAKKIGKVYLAGSSKDRGFLHIPKINTDEIPSDCQYLHITSNNTIYGTQYHQWPNTNSAPLICDMSSDIFSRQLEFNSFSLIYAGAQKNLGPAGVTLVIIHKDLLAKCKAEIPTMLDYNTHASKKSLYNTPPAFAIYMLRLVLDWIKNNGGLSEIEKNNIAKKERIYQMIDLNSDYYEGAVEKDSRSWMNITFRLPNEDLEKKFIVEAKAEGMGGLKGHRSAGGVRVSLYNAMTLDGAEKLANFMTEFMKKN